jgi:hypothetical protein
MSIVTVLLLNWANIRRGIGEQTFVDKHFNPALRSSPTTKRDDKMAQSQLAFLPQAHQGNHHHQPRIPMHDERFARYCRSG